MPDRAIISPMQRYRKWGLLAATVTFLHSACSVPEFEFRSEKASSSNVTTSTGGGQGPASSSITGSGGSGGSQPVCDGIDDLGKLGICGAGQKCTVADLNPVQVGCGIAGNKEEWFTCTTDNDCVDGTWCDGQTEICKPFCTGSGDCNFTVQGDCLTATVKQGGNVFQFDSVRVCMPNCNPKTADICVGPNTSCFFRPSFGFDCSRSSLIKEGQPCSDPTDCEVGTLCAAPPGEQPVCSKWCTPIGNSPDCSADQDCVVLTPTAEYNKEEHGACLSK